METRFDFATATRIVFGWGAIADLGGMAALVGRRAFVVTGRDCRRGQPILDQLSSRGIEATTYCIAGEPTTDQVRWAARMAESHGCVMVIGLGGGSALDAGKAVAALATNPGDPLDYLEVVGRGQVIVHPPLPYFAIPTTAGTGSEVTRNAVLTSPEHRVKASMRSPLMLPKVALVDPQLTVSLPPQTTACTGLDALTQLIEPYVCRKANPMTDALCREGMSRAARALHRACERGEDEGARTDMALASLMGGLALANSGLGAAHALAAVLGGMVAAPHGALCARLLGPVLRVNFRAVREQKEGYDLRARFDEIGRLLTGREGSTAEDGIAWVEDACEQLGIPRLATYGVGRDQFPTIIIKAQSASSMRANPVQLSPGQVGEILDSVL